MKSDIEDCQEVTYWNCIGDFNDEMLGSFIDFYQQAKNNNQKDAIIYINSPGGSVSAFRSIASIMENSDITFHTVVIGDAHSCGLLLLECGDVRWATDRADFCFHDMSCIESGKLDEIEEQHMMIIKESTKVIDRFSKRTKHDSAWWHKQTKKNVSRDYYFDSEKALEYGVIDMIGLPEYKMHQEQEILISYMGKEKDTGINNNDCDCKKGRNKNDKDEKKVGIGSTKRPIKKKKNSEKDAREKNPRTKNQRCQSKKIVSRRIVAR